MLSATMTIVSTPRWTLERIAGTSIVHARRSALPVGALSELEEDAIAIERVLPEAARRTLAILVDLRAGGMRNDPEFEEAIKRWRPRFLKGFRRVAVLVRTAVGALQVRRQGREQGEARAVFFDEKEAIAHLQELLKAN
jgi:hypothetical protein